MAALCSFFVCTKLIIVLSVISFLSPTIQSKGEQGRGEMEGCTDTLSASIMLLWYYELFFGAVSSSCVVSESQSPVYIVIVLRLRGKRERERELHGLLISTCFTLHKKATRLCYTWKGIYSV